MSIKTLSENFFWERNVYLSLWDVERNFSVQNIPAGLKNLDFPCPFEKSEEKHDFWKKASPTSDMQRNLVCFLSKLLRVYTARENCILRVHLNIFKTKNCFWKNQYFFSYFWDIDRFFPGLLAKVFCQVCKTATYLPRGTVQEKMFQK